MTVVPSDVPVQRAVIPARYLTKARGISLTALPLVTAIVGIAGSSTVVILGIVQGKINEESWAISTFGADDLVPGSQVFSFALTITALFLLSTAWVYTWILITRRREARDEGTLSIPVDHKVRLIRIFAALTMIGLFGIVLFSLATYPVAHRVFAAGGVICGITMLFLITYSFAPFSSHRMTMWRLIITYTVLVFTIIFAVGDLLPTIFDVSEYVAVFGILLFFVTLIAEFKKWKLCGVVARKRDLGPPPAVEMLNDAEVEPNSSVRLESPTIDEEEEIEEEIGDVEQ